MEVPENLKTLCGCSAARRRSVVVSRVLLVISTLLVIGIFSWLIVVLVDDHVERHELAWAVAGFCVVLTLPLTTYDVAQHALHYVHPPTQMLLIRILWMVPIYGVESWLSLRFTAASIYIETARECYEAYVLFSVHQLMIVLLVQNYVAVGTGTPKSSSAGVAEVLLSEQEDGEVGTQEDRGRSVGDEGGGGGKGDVESEVQLSTTTPPTTTTTTTTTPTTPLSPSSPFARAHEARKRLLPHAGDALPTDAEAVRVIRALGASEGIGEVPHQYPFCCLRPWRWSAFFHWTRWGVFQYVVVKVVCAVVACITQALGVYGEGDFRGDVAYPYLAFVINASQCWAMYCLILFYRRLHSHFPKHSKPVQKLALVKAVVFVSWWQGIVVAGLSYWGFVRRSVDYSKEEVVRGIQDSLICAEMLLAAIAHHYTFSYHDVVLDVVEFDQSPAAKQADGTGAQQAIIDMLPIDVVSSAARILGPNREASNPELPQHYHSHPADHTDTHSQRSLSIASSIEQEPTI